MASLDGFFTQVDYVFFRTEHAEVHDFADGFRVYDVSGGNPGGPRWMRRVSLLAAGLREIAAIARSAKPHVIAVVDPFISGAIGWTLARIHRVPLVVNLVSDYQMTYRVSGQKGIPFLPAWVCFAVERFVLSRADLVTADCDYYRKYAIHRGTRPQAVGLIPRYVTDNFYARENVDTQILTKLGIEDELPLVYVGRLSPEKYVLDLVDCLAVVCRDFPGRYLVIAGAGPLHREFRDRANSLGFGEQIKIVEGLSARGIQSLMTMAGVVLVTHGGYSLLEACMSGAAIVAYDFEWHPEVVIDGQTGCLVPYRDANAMASAAVRLLRDRDLAQAMGERARALGMARYKKDDCIAEQVKLFRRLLHAPGNTETATSDGQEIRTHGHDSV